MAFLRTPLTSVTIPNSVTTIGYKAFAESQIGSVAIGNSVRIIEPGAFTRTQLTSVTIPNSVTTISDRAFSGNSYLATVSIPDGLTSLASRAFEKNYLLTSIFYCGKLTDFPITPTCPPERQAVIDAAKAAADKAAADKAAADKAAADKAAADKIIQDAKLEAARILAAAKAAANKKTTITCVKGKLVKKVTAIKPKCPAGYKVKK